MVINHNLNAMNAHRQMIGNTSNAGKSMEKLSSGLRINRAGDDAAGLAISEKMRGQIRGLNQASRNSQDAISMIQTAEGALNETHSILQRMRELAVQASNDTNNSNDRGQIQKEIDQLTNEVNRIGNTTEFNTMKLLNGDKSDAKATGTTKDVVLSQVLTVNASKGFTITSNGVTLDSKVTIASTTTDIDWTKVDTSVATNKVIISKNSANGTLVVDIVAKESGAGTISALDTIDPTTITGDSITYNNHGISFTVKKSDLTAAGTGLLTLDLNAIITGTTVVGSFDSKNDFSTNTNSTASISNGITIDASTVDQRARSITMVSAGGDSAMLTITIKDSAGTALDTDIISASMALGTGTFSYNDHGISFSIKLTQTSSAFTSNAIAINATTKSITQDASLTFQVGANEHQSMSLSISDMRAATLGISSSTAGTSGFEASKTVNDGTNNKAVEYSLDVSTSATSAANAVTVIQAAIDNVSSERAKLGAYQNRLEHTIANLGTSSENLQAAESRIRDVDMASEMMSYSKNNVLTQAAQAMLAQANQAPQQVLQLLR